MTRPTHRVTLRIDRITVGPPGLDRAALEKALHREISRLIASHGHRALGLGGYRSEARADLPAGEGTSAASVAVATVNALKT